MITRQSTARTILVGPVLDSTGAAKTDEVVASIKITKNGTVGAANASATLTHNHAGKYLLALTASDTDTVGVLEISLNSGTNDMPVKGLNVVETAIWDALFADGATGLLPSNVTQFGGTNLTATAGIPEVKVASIATDAVNAAALAANAVAEIQSGLSTQTSVDAIQTDTNDIQARLPAALDGGRIAAALDSAAILAVADQVWDEATSGHTTAGTYGGRIVRATNSNTEVQITGSNHIAADVHDFQTGVITAGDFAANSLTASALATDAVTEIQSGLATSAALATESGKITNIENASGYLLAVLAGECADPQTASETYAITVFGSTFTVDMAGQTSTGTRTAPTLTKT